MSANDGKKDDETVRVQPRQAEGGSGKAINGAKTPATGGSSDHGEGQVAAKIEKLHVDSQTDDSKTQFHRHKANHDEGIKSMRRRSSHPGDRPDVNAVNSVNAASAGITGTTGTTASSSTVQDSFDMGAVPHGPGGSRRGSMYSIESNGSSDCHFHDPSDINCTSKKSANTSPTKRQVVDVRPIRRISTRGRKHISLQFLPIASESNTEVSTPTSSTTTSTSTTDSKSDSKPDSKSDSKAEAGSPEQVSFESGGSLILRRIQKTREHAQSQEAQEQSQSGLRELQQDFTKRRSSGSGSGIGWDFWAQVVDNYANVARTQPVKLRRAIQQGFPAQLRGLLWQVVATSKSPALEQLYSSLVVLEAPCAASITKDVNRTALSQSDANDHVDRDELFRVLKAYSLFDPDVGYTQGMAFVAMLLLDVNMSEYEVFCLFVQLMKTYDLRSLYIPDMPGLHLRLYQFDRMIEDRLEVVHTHLQRQGVQSSMYASQWFLTLFAYRFPVDLVHRILDVVIAEGIEAMLRFAFVLMETAVTQILTMRFDQLLPFLKEQIFDTFIDRPNDLVREAAAIDLTPAILARYELEFVEVTRHERERTEQMDTLRTANSRLTLQVRQLETELAKLSQEHIEIANKMVESGLENARLRHENEELSQDLSSFREASSELHTMQTVIQERNQLAEIRKRLEQQIQNLQEVLAQSM